MRKYSWNIFRWIKWVYCRIKYRNKSYINYYASKPVRRKWLYEKLKEEMLKTEWFIQNNPLIHIPVEKEKK